MKIEAIFTERILVPIKQQWLVRGGRGIHDHSPFLLVRIHCGGVQGIGEVSGTYHWSGEGFEAAEPIIQNVIAPALIGTEVTPRTARHAMDKVLAGFPFTKAAIEMACWDALGKAMGTSIATMLGGPVRSSVVSKFSISGREPEEAAEIARQAWDTGFRKFKVKVGTGLMKDLARVTAVRNALGEGVPLGVDANGGWSLGEARRALRPLEELGVNMIEQPLPEKMEIEISRLRAHSNIPILLDESVWDANDVARVAQLGAADAVNIYVGKSGGVLPALEAVQVARSLGLGVTLGSNQELGVGHAAVLHVLGAGEGFDFDTYAPDAAAPLYYIEDLVDPGFQLRNGEVLIPDGPGLGVSLKEDLVRKYRV